MHEGKGRRNVIEVAMVIQFQGLLPAPTSLIYLFSCAHFLKNKRGRKKSEHFCEEFPGMLGGFAVVLMRSPLGIAAQMC